MALQTKLLRVEWVDAESKSGWVDNEDALTWAKNDETARCVSVGYVVAETKAYLTLAASFHNTAVSELTKIPLGMIRKRKVIGRWPD